MTRIVKITQEDFENGHLVISASNVIYKLKSDIVFDPIVDEALANPYNPLDIDCPRKNKPCGENINYDNNVEAVAKICPNKNTNFKLGFCAAIVVLGNNVTIDLNGHKMEMSKNFFLMQRFFSHIQIGPSQFETGKGPATTFNTYKIFPNGTTVTSSKKNKRGVLGLSSHTSIMVIGHKEDDKNSVKVSNINFVDNEVGCGIFNLCADVQIENCDLDNANLKVPVSGSFSILVQNTSKLDKILAEYDDWFYKLNRDVDETCDKFNYEFEDRKKRKHVLNLQKNKCTKTMGKLILLMKQKRYADNDCDRSTSREYNEEINRIIRKIFDIKRRIGILKYYPNFPEGYPIDPTYECRKNKDHPLPHVSGDVEQTIRNMIELFKVRAAFDDMIRGVVKSAKQNNYEKISDPSLHEFYNPLGVPDGSSFYGFSFVNTVTPGIGDFQELPEDKRKGSISVRNFNMRNIQLNTLEIPGIDFRGEVNNDLDPNNDKAPTDVYDAPHTLKTMVGEILYLRDPKRSSLFFDNKLNIVEATIKQRKISKDNENVPVKFPDLSKLLGTMVIDDLELIKEIRDKLREIRKHRFGKYSDSCKKLSHVMPSNKEVLEGMRNGIKALIGTDLIGKVNSGSRYIMSLDQDIMQHKPKGIIGLKLEGIKSYSIHNVELVNITNNGLDYHRGLDCRSFFNKIDPDYKYGGCDITGVVSCTSGNTSNGHISTISKVSIENAKIVQDKKSPSMVRIINNHCETVIN